LANFIIGDEATFRLNGKVNTQNIREYAPQGERPESDYEVNTSRETCCVLVGVCGNGELFGTFFFESSVSGEKYLQVLNECLLPILLEKFQNQFNDGYFSRLWWAQDGAPTHRLAEVSHCLGILS